MQHICQVIVQGDKIAIPSDDREEFEIVDISPEGIKLLRKSTSPYIDAEKFQRVVGWLQKRCCILIGGQTHTNNPDSLYGLFKGEMWTPRHASFVAAILVKAKVAKYDKRNTGIRIRLCPQWKASAGGLRYSLLGRAAARLRRGFDFLLAMLRGRNRATD